MSKLCYSKNLIHFECVTQYNQHKKKRKRILNEYAILFRTLCLYFLVNLELPNNTHMGLNSSDILLLALITNIRWIHHCSKYGRPYLVAAKATSRVVVAITHSLHRVLQG